jgi:NodT family efflux transporter outer membrane factor (OMF) lipoprotein
MTPRGRYGRRTGAALALVALAGCRTAGPDYQQPTAPASAQWSTPSPWRPGDPKDAIPKGQWWTLFHDAELDALEARAADANQTLKSAAAQYEQARALTALTLSSIYPRLSAAAQAERLRVSGTRAGAGGEGSTQNSVTLPLSVSYEVDLFGKRLRSIEASRASLEASAAVLENVRLVVAADLASNYFTLRQIDTEIGILNRTSEALAHALDLVRARHDAGIASGLDVAQEETLLAATRTQATLLRRQRDELQHAIAVLVGQPAPGFQSPVKELTIEPPALDTGMPTDLLERRPDIAEAERQMAAANAKIGVARSAYFPSLDLFANGGWQSGSFLKLLDVPSLVWAIGATVGEDLFTGGARKAQVAYAEAGYDATVASYRETVLRALAEVEDELTGLEVLRDAETTQVEAVSAATRALGIANVRYGGGLTSSLEVVLAQQALLNHQRLAAQIRGERLVTTVVLVKALGGGWKR